MAGEASRNPPKKGTKVRLLDTTGTGLRQTFLAAIPKETPPEVAARWADFPIWDIPLLPPVWAEGQILKAGVNGTLAWVDDPAPDLSGFVAKVDLATLADAAGLAKKSDIPAATPAPDLSGYQPKGNYITQQAFSDAFSTIPQAPNLTPYALKTDLPDLSSYAKKADVPAAPNLSGYALKTDVPSLTNYALKSDIPSLAAYAIKSDLTGLEKVTKLPDVTVAQTALLQLRAAGNISYDVACAGALVGDDLTIKGKAPYGYTILYGECVEVNKIRVWMSCPSLTIGATFSFVLSVKAERLVP